MPLLAVTRPACPRLGRRQGSLRRFHSPEARCRADQTDRPSFRAAPAALRRRDRISRPARSSSAGPSLHPSACEPDRGHLFRSSPAAAAPAASRSNLPSKRSRAQEHGMMMAATIANLLVEVTARGS
mmetsp:Transcript_8025/g.15935  ORF Transcript_8025/g.15935 Transcript_8025/m.15935 type:complete len:127 (-) Transcript_8025:1427-1807(-)